MAEPWTPTEDPPTTPPVEPWTPIWAPSTTEDDSQAWTPPWTPTESLSPSELEHPTGSLSHSELEQEPGPTHWIHQFPVQAFFVCSFFLMAGTWILFVARVMYYGFEDFPSIAAELGLA